MLFLGIIFLSYRGASAQETILPYWQADTSIGLDYNSFPGQMMLSFAMPDHFTKLPKNPIIKPSHGGWDRRDTADPYVVVRADSVYLFYDGNDNNRYHIGYAVLDSIGWGWEKRGRIFSGSGAAWDSYHQIAPAAVVQGNRWSIFYSGNSSDSELGYQLGQFHWNRANRSTTASPKPMLALSPDDWDFAGNNYADVLYLPRQNRYLLYYSGFQGPLASIGLAESRDGIHWTKHPAPVLSGLPGVIAPEVIFDGSRFWMFYVQSAVSGKGIRTSIYMRRSSDGKIWSPGKLVLSPTAAWESGQLMRPQLAYYQQRLYLHYCAGKGRWKIGAAYADPVFRPQGTWRSKRFPPGTAQIRIRYEQPRGTLLEFYQVGQTTKERRRLAFPGAPRELRIGVYETLIDWEGDERESPSLEIVFSTSDPRRTPVLYELSLLGK